MCQGRSPAGAASTHSGAATATTWWSRPAWPAGQAGLRCWRARR